MNDEAAVHSDLKLNRFLIFGLMLGLFMSGLDASIVNIMLPKLQSVFAVSITRVMLIATVYLTLMSAFQLFAGRCADIFNPLIVFITGLILFFAGSLGCAMAQILPHIIIGRGIQGIGAAVLAASFGAIVLLYVPKEKTGSVLGAVMMVMSLGVIIGPPLGGFLAEHLSWHWAFVINLPFAAIAAAFLLNIERKSRAHSTGIKKVQPLQQLDLPGTLFSIIMLVALPMIFSLGAQKGWDSAAFFIACIVFVISLTLFIGAERRSRHPLVQLEIFRNPFLVLTVLMKIITMILMNGVMLVFPFFITGSSSMDVSQAGLYLLISAVSMAVITPVAGKMTDRFQSIPVIVVASCLLLATFSGAFFIGPDLSKIIMGMVLAGFGAAMAALMVATSVLILKQAPVGQEGVFSALNSLVVPVGGAMGLALFAALYSSGKIHGGEGGQAFAGFTLAMQGGIVCTLLLFCTVFLYNFFLKPRSVNL